MPRKPNPEPISPARALALLSWGPDANRDGAAKGGRPRSATERCSCGASTLKRAQARGKEPIHNPTCEWYKERAIAV